MSVQGLCRICERAPVDHQCPRCGSPVCADHYETGVGVCTNCARGVE